MGICGDDYLNPVMYQDISTASMQPVPSWGLSGTAGAEMPQTNFLGGITMQGQLDNDKYQKMQDKEKKDFGLMKKVGLAILVLGGLGLVKFSKIGKWISGKSSGVTNWCKNLFKKKTP